MRSPHPRGAQPTVNWRVYGVYPEVAGLARGSRQKGNVVNDLMPASDLVPGLLRTQNMSSTLITLRRNIVMRRVRGFLRRHRLLAPATVLAIGEVWTAPSTR